MALAVSPLASGQADVRALQGALHGKQLGLRSYSADADAQYKWVNGGLVTGAVHLHGLEAFLTDSVTLKNGKIVIKGNRETLVRNGTDMATAGRTPMTLEIDLQGANPAVVIPQLQTALFFLHLQDAIAGLPKMVAQMLPASAEKIPTEVNRTKTKERTISSTRDFYRIYKDGNWIDIKKSGSKYTPPDVIKTADPVFSQEAIDKKISGTVSLALHVSENGRVDEVWLLRPLGFGLDESAANTVRQYVFRPAQLDGKPVEAEQTMGVNFQIF
jgi:TonB family protein